MNALTQPTTRKITMPPLGRIARVIAIALLRVLTTLVIVLLGVPVALLTVNTPVPPAVWILLALVDAGLVVVLFRFGWTVRASGAAIAGSLVVAVLAVASSQVFASTPPIADAQGNVLPGSIATMEQVKLVDCSGSFLR